jgi:hypothetical protein
VVDPVTEKYDEYAPVAWKWRTIIMLSFGIVMLIVNLSKEFSALRYLSVFVIGSLIFTIVVSLDSFSVPNFIL